MDKAIFNLVTLQVNIKAPTTWSDDYANETAVALKKIIGPVTGLLLELIPTVDDELTVDFDL